MRKAIKYLVQVTLLLLFTLGVGLWSYNITRWVTCTLHTQNDTVHIFFEPYATTPELGELLAFAQLPAKTPKIIAWHRLTKVGERLDLRALNTYEVALPAREGLIWTAMRLLAYNLNLLSRIHPEWKKVVFYTNLHHIKTMLLPFLRQFPQFEIAHIHFYEDGFANVIGSGYPYYKKLRYPDTETLKKTMLAWQKAGFQGIPEDENVFTSFQLIYPVTYHLGLADKIKKDPALKHFVTHIERGQGKLESLDFKKTATILTPAQKDIVFKAVGFDAAAWKEQNDGKTVFVFTLGFVFKNAGRIVAQRKLLNKILPRPLSQTACWIKEHPNMDAESAGTVLGDLPSVCRLLPKNLPFEILLMADPAPDIVAGYSSSLFYTVPSERIAGYIPRSNNDSYTRRLKEIGILRKERIYSVSDLISGKK